MGKKMNFNYVNSLWQSPGNSFDIEIENTKDKMLVKLNKDNKTCFYNKNSKDVLFNLTRKYRTTYEKGFDYNTLTEKIKEKEKEIEELKFLRSCIGKKLEVIEK